MPRDRFFFAQAAAAILRRSKDGGGDEVIVHLDLTASKKTASEQLARLDGHGRQLWAAFEDVADSKDVGHVRPFLIVGDKLPHGIRFQARSSKVQPAGISRPANRIHHGVVRLHPSLLRLGRVERHFQTSISPFNNLGRRGLIEEIRAKVMHHRANLLGALAVEPTEENGTHSHVRLTAQLSEKTRAFEGNIGPAHAQGFAWRRWVG